MNNNKYGYSTSHGVNPWDFEHVLFAFGQERIVAKQALANPSITV